MNVDLEKLKINFPEKFCIFWRNSDKSLLLINKLYLINLLYHLLFMELGSHWRVKLHLETTAEVGRHSTPIERLIFGSDYGWKPPLRTYGKTIMTLEMYLRFEKALESHCSSVTALSNLWESQNYLEITIGRVKRHWEAIGGVKRLESNQVKWHIDNSCLK